MRKITLLLFFVTLLMALTASASHVTPPPFEGLIGGKIDPNIGLIKDSDITIVQQTGYIIQGNTEDRENVVVEYKYSTPITGDLIDLQWNGYKSKAKEQNINLDELKTLAKDDNVLAIWAKVDAIPLELCEVSCTWGYAGPTSKELNEEEGITELWAKGYTGSGAYVMIVDTGVDPSAYVSVADELTKHKDYHSGLHGTRSASTIASYDSDFPGVAKGATIVDCPAVSPANEYSIAQCYQWAIDNYEQHGWPQVISNSWGYVEPVSQNYYETRKIKEAADKGIVVIMAATNCGDGCGSYSSCCGEERDGQCITPDLWRGPGKSITGPNQLGQVITVAAFDADDKKREGYSSQGPSYAPGGDYVANKPDISSFADFRVKYGDTIQNYAGTSAATPWLAGVVALMFDANPSITSSQIKSILITNARYPSTCVGDCTNDVGKGLVAPYETVLQAAGTGPICGDDICQSNENEVNCPDDCSHMIVCGDDVCEGAETFDNCPADCANACAGLNCNDYNSCTTDTCKLVNGLPGCYNYPITPCCGNGICEIGEGIWICTADCDKWQCQDNCEYLPSTGEIRAKGQSTCAPQCSDYCGDGICGLYEDYENCREDCEEPPNELPLTGIIIGSIAGIVIVGGTAIIIKRKKRKWQ